MSGARNNYALLLIIPFLIIGCTEKKEKVINPHKDQTTEKRAVSKETLLLFSAIEKNNLELLKNKIPEIKNDPGVQNMQGDTLLVFAAGKGKKDAVKILLQAGVPVNDYSGQGDTALVRAAAEGSVNIVKILLEARANPNLVGMKTYLGASPLFLASSVGSVEIVELLLKNGADINLANLHGVTPLMDAAYGSLDTVKLLLKHGANPGMRDESGNTAMKIARQENQKEIVKVLKIARKKYKKSGKK